MKPRSIFLLVAISWIVFQPVKVFCQTGKEILIMAYEKAKNIHSGYYEMTRKMKYMSRGDTATHISQCFFRRLPEDDIFGFAFYQPFFDTTGLLTSQLFYTGEELVRTTAKDSSGVVTSTSAWAQHIKDVKHNYDFFEPLTSPDDENIPHTFKHEGDYRVDVLEPSQVHAIPCHHIRIIKRVKNDPKDPVEMLRSVSEYWVSKNDSLILQYTTAYDMVMNNDTMFQFEQLTLDSFQLNSLPEDAVPSFSFIPSYYNLTDYTPYEREELLTNNTLAPDWTLTSLQNEQVSLADLKGRIVLIDFFYKGCFPCMQALPALQALHEKYHDKGLSVIGIDPYDKDADDLHKFLSKRGVTYTILLAEKDFPKAYKVSGYPTIYLLNEEGLILLAQSGYGEGTENRFEKIIKKQLKD